MDNYMNMCAEVFLRDQEKLFDEPVAETIEEAIEFLEDCYATVLRDINEVREYLEDQGMDVDELSDEELEDELEVFKLDNGMYFVVMA